MIQKIYWRDALKKNPIKLRLGAINAMGFVFTIRELFVLSGRRMLVEFYEDDNKTLLMLCPYCHSKLSKCEIDVEKCKACNKKVYTHL